MAALDAVKQQAVDAVKTHAIAAVLGVCGPLLVPIVLVLFCALVLAAVVSDPADSATAVASTDSVPGVDPQVLEAFNKAAAVVSAAKPECHGMNWPIIAGIAEIESSTMAGHTIAANGDVTPRIIGPAIGFADTDGGKWDGLANEDRAAGPTQFIPETWAHYGLDGNGDGVADPHNIYDAFAGTANYICGDQAADLSDDAQLRKAIFRYNHANWYVDEVMAAIEKYRAAAATSSAGEAATGTAADVIAAAKAYLGTTYAWGGGGPSGPTRGIRDGGVADSFGDYNKIGFDCSGLTQYAYAQVGISLPRISRAQAVTGTLIPREKGFAALQPGDLVFWAYAPNNRATVHHVGIYLGDGMLIHAPQSGSTVRIDPMWTNGYAGGVRLI